jgi:ParB/RepB/Spo0J family partition protein
MTRSAAKAFPAVEPPVEATEINWPQGIVDRPFRDIELGEWNPRYRIDPAEIATLADSIAAKGILQNLITRPVSDHLEVVAGSRRWRAVAKLIAEDRKADDFPMPVRIVPMSDRDALCWAMTENLQRQDMSPLEEADGFARMVEMGDTVETIAADTGYPKQRILQRLALHHRLSSAVRSALEDGQINLGQAQAFTLGEKDRQAELLQAVIRAPRQYEPGDIRRVLSEHLIPLSRAIFARADYKAAVRKDLFHDEEFAEDRAEFQRLQVAAVQKKREELAETWRWAEVRRGGFVYLQEFERDDRPSKSGAIVHLRDDLRVEIHTGLVKHEAAPARTGGAAAPTTCAAAGTPPATGAPAATPAPAAPADPARPFSKAHLIWARQEKSRRLQLAVADNPAAACSLAIIGILGSQEVKVSGGTRWPSPVDDNIDNPVLATRIEKALGAVAGKGFVRDLRLFGAHANGRPGLGEAELFRRLMAMPGVDRLALLSMLIAEHVGTWPGYQPDLGDSQLSIAVAEACGIEPPGKLGDFDMSTAYLERLSKDRLAHVAKGAGVEEDVAPLTKSMAIDAIALSSTRNPAWFPPELHFGTRPELMRLLTTDNADPPGGGKAA